MTYHQGRDVSPLSSRRSCPSRLTPACELGTRIFERKSCAEEFLCDRGLESVYQKG